MGKKIQGQGITADEVTGRTLYLLLSTGPTQEGRNDGKTVDWDVMNQYKQTRTVNLVL